MFNDFVVVGPAADPAGVRQAVSAADAFGRLARSRGPFVSRGDDSGTHKKEQAIWQASGTRPAGRWYREAGQGMGKVLQMANEMDAYTLTDRGTWLAYRDKSQLQIVLEGDQGLHNPYAIIRVSEQRYPDLNHSGARALIAWLRGHEGQQAIAAFRRSGEQLFRPSAGAVARR